MTLHSKMLSAKKKKILAKKAAPKFKLMPRAPAGMIKKSKSKQKRGRKMDSSEQKLLKDLRELCERQDAELKRIAEAPLQTATIGYIDGPHVFVGSGGNFVRLLKPDFDIEIGDLVLCHPMTNQLVEVCCKIPSTGIISSVKSLFGMFAEVDGQGQDNRVMIGKFGPNPNYKEGEPVPLQKGDRVMLDASRSVIIENLGRKESVFAPESIPQVRWDDIGGQEEAKQIMREAIEYPHKYGELYKAYNKKACKGVLLWGSPGCGKTLIGKAAARELAEIYNSQGADTGFMYIKGPEILNKYVGASEGAVRRIFRQAELHKEKHGYPCVVFIDEADAILGKRGSHGSALSSTLVPMFLTEMDGLEESAALIILATNRQDVLDPAVVRDGRIDRKIKVTRPDRSAALRIVEINLARVPTKADKKELAELVIENVFSEKSRRLFRFKDNDGEKHYMFLHDTLNGAMLAGIVDMATSFAIRREIENGIKKKVSGIIESDLIRAIDVIDQQARDLNHDDNIREFLEERGLSPEDVKMDKAKKQRMVSEVQEHHEATLSNDLEEEAA